MFFSSLRTPLRRMLVVLSAFAGTLVCAIAGDTANAKKITPGQSYAPSKPAARALYSDGPAGRYLLNGNWLFRSDPTNVGEVEQWQNQGDYLNWTQVRVPNAWNAMDHSDESMLGGVGWYRKDFTLPNSDKALKWIVRFESVNYRAKVWLNGRLLGNNIGAYLPFEFQLARLNKKGVNRLVVRVDSQKNTYTFPRGGREAGGRVRFSGWWNYGGILREVYVRSVRGVDFSSVAVTPRLRCATCGARVDFALRVRNHSRKTQAFAIAARLNRQLISLKTGKIEPGAEQQVTKTLRIARPRLWSPRRPYLYPVALTVTNEKKTARAQYQLHTGIRSIKVKQGRLFLNDRPLNFRGVGLHEESRNVGAAISSRDRQQLVGDAQALGATVLRSHYPLHPETHELADRAGMLIWSEIPVYHYPEIGFRNLGLRRLALQLLRKDIAINRNHPSVLLWSIGNENPSSPGEGQRKYISQASDLAQTLDGTRPTAMVLAARPGISCDPLGFAGLDVLGINEYFGWYWGALDGEDQLSPLLDSIRACHNRKALVVTEFGAEASGDGPSDQKGTFEFQRKFVNYHLRVFGQKSWLSGVMYWALNEFWVGPGWKGANPIATTVGLHKKGLLTSDHRLKPAWADVYQNFVHTRQY